MSFVTVLRNMIFRRLGLHAVGGGGKIFFWGAMVIIILLPVRENWDCMRQGGEAAVTIVILLAWKLKNQNHFQTMIFL